MLVVFGAPVTSIATPRVNVMPPSVETPANNAPPSLTTVPVPRPVAVRLLSAVIWMPTATGVAPIAATCRLPLLMTVPSNSSATTLMPRAAAKPGACAVTVIVPSFSIVPAIESPGVESFAKTPTAEAEPKVPTAWAETLNVPEDVLRMLTVPGSTLTNSPVAWAKALAVVAADADATALTLKVPELVNDSTPPERANWSTPSAKAEANASVVATATALALTSNVPEFSNETLLTVAPSALWKTPDVTNANAEAAVPPCATAEACALNVPELLKSTDAVDAARPEPSANWNTPVLMVASADANPAAVATAFARMSIVPVLVSEMFSVTESNAS